VSGEKASFTHLNGQIKFLNIRTKIDRIGWPLKEALIKTKKDGDMAVNWITPENVITIASYLINIDELSIRKEYQFELDTWVFNLREALSQYLQCDNAAKSCLSNIESMEYHLRTLLEYTKAFVSLFTREAKDQLRRIVLGEEVTGVTISLSQ
jgi:hypothetical protein